MKYWIVKDANDVLHVVGAQGFVPDGALAAAPIDELTGKHEDPAWLQIEDIQDPETLQWTKVATVNQVLKDQILADRDAAKQADAAAKAAKKADIKAKRDKIKAFKKADLGDANGIRQAIDDIMQMVKALNLEVFGDDKD